MRFLFVTSGPRVPSTRYRVLPYLPLLEQAGHRCDVAHSWPEKYESFRLIGWRLSQRLQRTVRHWHATLARARHYDAILIEREVFDDDTSHLERRFRAATKRLVLDVDDGIFLLHPGKFDTVCGMVDVAIAGNRNLAKVMEPRCRQVITLPTSVRLGEYTARSDPPPGKTPVVGWIGTPHNIAFLQVAAPALRTLAREMPFRLLIVSSHDQRLREIDLSGVDTEFRVWSPTRDIADLQEMDVGIMPLPVGDPWMEYKCGLKLIQYLAVGTPAVASPIGVNADILAGGDVGFAATNDEEWLEGLRRLLNDTELRKSMGHAGRQLVERHYSIEGHWRRWMAALTGEAD